MHREAAALDQRPFEHVELVYDPSVASDAIAASEQDMEELVTQTAAFLLSLLKSRLPEAYKPLADRVLIRPLYPEDTILKNGLYLLNQQNKAGDTGIVVSVGPGEWSASARMRIPTELYPGQGVIFSKYSGESVTLAGVGFRLIKIQDILAVLE